MPLLCGEEIKMDKTSIHSLINSVIIVADKFINKVETGRARSKETYSDLMKLKDEALLLKTTLADKTV